MWNLLLNKCKGILKKRYLSTILRLVISVSLIAFLLTTANLGELWSTLKTASILYLVIALLFVFVRVFISAYRWQIMLSPKGIHVPLSSLTCFYFVGNFFNMFLPTVLGGDVVRGYELARYSRHAVDSVATVLMERILGFFALFLICWISLIFGFRALEGTNILLIVGGVSGAFLLFMSLLFNTKLTGMILSLTGRIKRWNVEGALKETYKSIRSFTASKKVLLNAFVISLLYQFVGIVSVFFISQSLGLGVSFVYVLIAVPIICVIMMAPISISGLGVREGAFVLFFTQQGVSIEDALLLSLLFFALTVFLALVGGLIYAWGGYRRKEVQPEKE